MQDHHHLLRLVDQLDHRWVRVKDQFVMPFLLHQAKVYHHHHHRRTETLQSNQILWPTLHRHHRLVRLMDHVLLDHVLLDNLAHRVLHPRPIEILLQTELVHHHHHQTEDQQCHHHRRSHLLTEVRYHLYHQRLVELQHHHHLPQTEGHLIMVLISLQLFQTGGPVVFQTHPLAGHRT